MKNFFENDQWHLPKFWKGAFHDGQVEDVL